MRVAITGHRGLDGPSAYAVETSIRATLLPYAQAGDRLVGVSCLADGADQIFARVVLSLGGRLEAVVLDSAIPQPRSRADLEAFQALLRQSTVVQRISCRAVDGAMHLRAGLAMLERVDLLVAVWDGLPGRGPGGTADMVAHARRTGIPLVVIWPDGARRAWPIRQTRSRPDAAARPDRVARVWEADDVS